MSVHLVELTDGACRRAVVLKRFPRGVGSPENEWDALYFAHSAELPSPAPLLNDLGRLRGAIAIRPGGDAPDLLAAAYAARTGRSLEGLAYWDILTGALTLQNAANRHPLYEAPQVPLEATEVAARATAFIDTALAQLRDHDPPNPPAP